MTIQIPHPTVVLHGDGMAMACGLEGEVRAEELHGLFVADTRVVSSYRITIAGERWQLVGQDREGHGTATWMFQSPLIRTRHGDVSPGSLFLKLRRRVSAGLHDDLTIRGFADTKIETRLIVQLDSDFADIFEVKDRRLPPRLDVVRIPAGEKLTLLYERAGFRRALHVDISTSDRGRRPIEFVGSQLIFDLALAHAEEWTCCIHAEAELDGVMQTFAGDPHAPEPELNPDFSPSLQSELVLQSPCERGCADLHALAVADNGTSFFSAGVPWFMCLFGRDTLVSALMTGVLGDWPARGSLAALARLQATVRDDWRDGEPGKLPHELRRGELAFRKVIPHTPYYGTHDAPALFCLTLWNAWRWTGDDSLLAAHMGTAERALQWCDDLGDRDGDGLQEYGTRSRLGYYNQSWKDATDAILEPTGELVKLPIATVELQGYLYAARLAMAEMYEHIDQTAEASRLRDSAATLRRLVEERYWLEDEDFYAVAIGGDKQPVRTVSSNPGHLLWCGLPSPDHARRTAERLVADDMFSGWGLRTLSTKHPRYNPMSYQRGSVWPHDTMLAAAGMVRYGLDDMAATLMRGLLDAACAFEASRLPELFCGIERDLGGPVPYAEANIPQAWAAAAAPLAVQLLLGLVPDASHGRCYLNPRLPDWLPRLEIDRLSVGGHSLRVVLARDGESTVVKDIEAAGIEVVDAPTSAALWGNVTT